MIRCEHFVYGQFNGVGYKFIQSSGVDRLLTFEDIENLKRLSKPGVYVSLRPHLNAPSIVVVSFVRHSRDEKGRSGVWLHSILMTAEEYVSLVPTQFFDDYFIKHLDKPPRNLEPLHIP